MHYYCDQSENSRLIVDRFVKTCDGVSQLFLSGPKGSEFRLLIKEYCREKGIDEQVVVSIEPSMLDESLLGQLMVMLSHSISRPQLLLVRVNSSIDAVSEAKLLKFLNNPALNDSKLVVILEGYDPYEEMNPYSETLSEFAKSSLFVLPPLRNRVGDLAHFTLELIKSFEASGSIDAPIRLETSAMELLLSYDWPGNYDELNEVLRVVVSRSKRGGNISRDQLVEVINHGRNSPVE